MYRLIPEYISAWRYRLSRIPVVVGMVWLSILIIAGSPPAAYAEGMPGGNVSDPVVRAVDTAKPAVVRIITFMTGHLTVQFSATQNVTFPQGGNGYDVVLSGSGTFITAHGDILTADHVINPPRSDLDQFLQQQAAQDVATYMNQTLHVNPPTTSDQVAAELASGQLPSNTQYNTPRSRAYLSTDYTGALNVPDVQSIPANLYAPVDRIEQQSSFNQKDVAIIHVSNMDDRAMVQLGNSSNVQQQDDLTIIGFPGNGDVSNNPTDLLTLSVNKVFVSAIKTTDTGAPVIQVGGNVEHGDSGGPALDNNGTIVGIVSFGSSNGSGSTSFLQASNSASTLVQSLKLDTTPGRFQKTWQQAFADYASNAPGHWHKAQREFQQIAVQYPSFKAIKPYLDYTTTQAKTEKPVQQPQQTTQRSSTGSPVLNALTSKWTIIAAGIVLLLALLLFGGVVLQRRRGKQVPASVAPASSLNRLSPGSTSPAQSRPIDPSQSAYGPWVNEGMAAFGAPMSPAPPRPVQPPAQPPASQPQRFPPGVTPSQAPTFSTNSPTVPSNFSGALVPWPCGHMNRPVARYCSVCGEPAPQAPTIRKYEQ
jgi:Trypsin-like peptidase domain